MYNRVITLESEEMEGNTKGRPISRAAHLLSLLDRFQPGNAVYTADIEGDLSEEALVKGLKRLQEKYELLQCKVVNTGLSFRWVPVNWQNLPIPLETHPISEAPSVYATAIDYHFEVGNYPLLKCYLFKKNQRQYTVSLNICHSLVDGTGGTVLLCDLLNLVQQPEQPEVKPISMLPDIDRLYPKKHRGIRGKFSAFPTMRHMNRLSHSNQLPMLSTKIASGREMKVSTLTFSEANTTALLRNCKRHEATLTGALMAALFITVRHEMEALGKIPLTAAIPVNMRNKFNPPLADNHVDMLASSLFCDLSVGPSESFWTLANQCRKRVMQRLAAEEHFASWNMALPRILSSANLLGKSFPKTYLKHSPKAVSIISNIGVLDKFQVNHHHFKVKNISFFVLGQIITPMGITASSYHGVLTLHFTYSSKRLGQSYAERLVKGFERILMEHTTNKTKAVV